MKGMGASAGTNERPEEANYRPPGEPALRRGAGATVRVVSPEEAIAEIRALLAQGEHLAAYDTAQDPHATEAAIGAQRLELRYLRALTLARSGATSRAEDQLGDLEADLAGDDISDELAEDVAALGARLAKDRALAAHPGEQGPLLIDAATRYEAVYRRLSRPYACINAATLWHLAGHDQRAGSLAHRAVELCATTPADTSTGAYWAAVTRAEAALVLGHLDDAHHALVDAADTGVDDYAARASTRRQLRLLCTSRGVADTEAFLSPIANPAVVHYCGHRLDPPARPERFPASAEGHVRSEIDAWLCGRWVGSAHGSLASGADLIAAEALLAHGAALHVVLPFDVGEFLTVSVADAGPAWVDRFHHCLHAAASVTVACDSASLGDDALFGYAARLAMGHGLNRAARLETDAWQLAVWDGQPGPTQAGTSHDVAAWSAAGHPTHHITLAREPVGAAAPSGKSCPPVRAVRSILFGDVKGFSRLRDEHLGAFQDVVMGAVADALDRFGERVLHRNTWGDGLFAIASDVVTGAEAALAIQDALARLDLTAAGLPPDLAMRIGGHVGPLLPVWDPVLRAPTLMGRELTRAARIEPRTPPGEVYVTGAFAALLALQPSSRIVPEYVGHLTTAKAFETVPMYVLRTR